MVILKKEKTFGLASLRSFSLLANALSTFDSYQELKQHVDQHICGKGGVISFANANAFNTACRDKEFLSAILKSELVVRDGIGVKILFHLLKKNAGYNLNGTDLIPKLLEQCFQDQRIALLGSTYKELAIAETKLANQGLNVVVTEHGFLDSKDYISLVQEAAPQVVLLAMGMPKQEKLAIELKNANPNLVIINGGAVIDFMAGKINRAPALYRKFGLEWLYRLIQEPRRLFKRYVLGNFSFLARAMIFVRQSQSYPARYVEQTSPNNY